MVIYLIYFVQGVKNMDSLFDIETCKNAPLAERMRANSLEDFVGQKHIVLLTCQEQSLESKKIGKCDGNRRLIRNGKFI